MSARGLQVLFLLNCLFWVEFSLMSLKLVDVLFVQHFLWPFTFVRGGTRNYSWAHDDLLWLGSGLQFQLGCRMTFDFPSAWVQRHFDFDNGVLISLHFHLLFQFLPVFLDQLGIEDA